MKKPFWRIVRNESIDINYYTKLESVLGSPPYSVGVVEVDPSETVFQGPQSSVAFAMTHILGTVHIILQKR